MESSVVGWERLQIEELRENESGSLARRQAPKGVDEVLALIHAGEDIRDVGGVGARSSQSTASPLPHEVQRGAVEIASGIGVALNPIPPLPHAHECFLHQILRDTSIAHDQRQGGEQPRSLRIEERLERRGRIGRRSVADLGRILLHEVTMPEEADSFRRRSKIRRCQHAHRSDAPQQKRVRPGASSLINPRAFRNRTLSTESQVVRPCRRNYGGIAETESATNRSPRQAAVTRTVPPVHRDFSMSSCVIGIPSEGGMRIRNSALE